MSKTHSKWPIVAEHSSDPAVVEKIMGMPEWHKRAGAVLTKEARAFSAEQGHPDDSLVLTTPGAEAGSVHHS